LSSPPRQQLTTLKPDTRTPTTCSTVVLNMGSDSVRAKRHTKTLPTGWVCTPTAVAVFPAIVPPLKKHVLHKRIKASKPSFQHVH
jgi:hypothetical protein